MHAAAATATSRHAVISIHIEWTGSSHHCLGNGCGDCLLQVDPKTGDLIQNYGSVNHASVFGIAFWAGTAYGFDNGGDVFSIGWQNGKLVTTAIPVPNPPPDPPDVPDSACSSRCCCCRRSCVRAT